MTDLLALLCWSLQILFFAWPLICMAFPPKKHPATPE